MWHLGPNITIMGRRLTLLSQSGHAGTCIMMRTQPLYAVRSIGVRGISPHSTPDRRKLGRDRAGNRSSDLVVSRKETALYRRALPGTVAFGLFTAMALGTASASPPAQARSASDDISYDFLITVLNDARDRETLTDDISELLSDLLIEYLIAPVTGETPEEAGDRLSDGEQSPFDLLIAVLTEARDGGALPAGLSDPLSDLFIEYLIAPHTGETGAQVRERLSVQAAPPPEDLAPLVALYSATGGSNWTDRANWLSDGPLGSWRGVVTDESGRVTELDLSDNGLDGGIPPELGSLSSLTTLDLSSNELGGRIPPELGDLAAWWRWTCLTTG